MSNWFQGEKYQLQIVDQPEQMTAIEELQRIVGERYVVYGDAEQLEAYGHDEVADTHYAHRPDVVVKPETPEEIAAIMKLANRERIPVTPRGAGSGLSGGAVPIYGGIVLSIERMNKVIELDTANMTITNGWLIICSP